MSRERSTIFNMSRIAQSCAGDDIEALLIESIGHQFEQLWPGTLRPPSALIDLHTAICVLIDWNARSPKGKAIMRKRILRLIAELSQDPQFDTNDLAKNAHALLVVPGILQQEEDAQLEPDDAAQLADDVASWLAGAD